MAVYKNRKTVYRNLIKAKDNKKSFIESIYPISFFCKLSTRYMPLHKKRLIKNASNTASFVKLTSKCKKSSFFMLLIYSS